MEVPLISKERRNNSSVLQHLVIFVLAFFLGSLVTDWRHNKIEEEEVVGEKSVAVPRSSGFSNWGFGCNLGKPQLDAPKVEEPVGFWEQENAVSLCVNFGQCCNWPVIGTQCEEKVKSEKPDSLVVLKKHYCPLTETMKFPDRIDMGIYALRLASGAVSKAVDMIPFVGTVTQLIKTAADAAKGLGFDVTLPLKAFYSCLATPNLHAKMHGTKIRNALSVLLTDTTTKRTDLINWYYLLGLASDPIYKEVPHKLLIKAGTTMDQLGIKLDGNKIKKVEPGGLAARDGITADMFVEQIDDMYVDGLDVEMQMRNFFNEAQLQDFEIVFNGKKEKEHGKKRFPMTCRAVYSFRFCGFPALLKAIPLQGITFWIAEGILQEKLTYVLEWFMDQMSKITEKLGKLYSGIKKWIGDQAGKDAAEVFNTASEFTGKSAQHAAAHTSGRFELSPWDAKENAADSESINFFFMYLKKFRQRIKEKLQKFWGCDPPVEGCAPGKINLMRLTLNFHQDPVMVWMDISNAIIEEFIAPLLFHSLFNLCDRLRDEKYMGDEPKPNFDTVEKVDPTMEQDFDAVRTAFRARGRSKAIADLDTIADLGPFGSVKCQNLNRDTGGRCRAGRPCSDWRNSGCDPTTKKCMCAPGSHTITVPKGLMCVECEDDAGPDATGPDAIYGDEVDKQGPDATGPDAGPDTFNPSVAREGH